MSLPAWYFEHMYEEAQDPWGFRTRWYESRKRSLVLSSLQSERYGTAFEPGCSIGVLSEGLAARTDQLLAMDVSPRALDSARQVLPGHVALRRGQVPQDWPTGHFDLVVVSELAYYLVPVECELLADLAAAAADELIVVHWRHPVVDYPLGGDEVRTIFSRAATKRGLAKMLSHVEPDFCIDTWCRDGRSVAARAGLTAK